MSDIKLFSIARSCAQELSSKTALLEKNLQQLIESQMEVFLGVHMLASEYSTGKTHKGRIDSLGLDENGCPVIIEYKRHSNENVINQGLFYLDWLLDHQAEFQLLVLNAMDQKTADAIEWNGTRLICIASDFNRYDIHAVQQINRSVELMRYRYFGEELLLLELINAQTAATPKSAHLPPTSPPPTRSSRGLDKSHEERVAEASPELQALYAATTDFIELLGDEVQRKDLKHYAAFKKIKNFASIVVQPGQRDERLQVYLKLPGELAEHDGFTRDVSNIGHWGTGNLEVNLRSLADLDKAKPVIEKSYSEN